MRPRKLNMNYKIPEDKIQSITLKNGMKIIAYQDKAIPKVLTQVAYDVGSSIENSYEKGLAHLVEHMIFKGTEKLKEGDIDAIARKLGADFNAYTTNDVTSYYFYTDKNNWKPFLSILSDCMTNARFDDQHLASELKAVVQELNMYKDHHLRSACEKTFELLYPSNHPYHFPIIGFKEELAGITAKEIKEFYQKYYKPAKAALFVAGDIEFEDVFSQAKKEFEHIENQGEILEPNFFDVIPTLESKKHVMYEQVEQENLVLSWRIPGIKQSCKLPDVVAQILGKCEGRVLQNELVDNKKIANSVGAFCWQLRHGGILIISVKPKEGKMKECQDAVFQVLEKVSSQGVDDFELQKVVIEELTDQLNTQQKVTDLVYNWIYSFFATKSTLSYFEEINQISKIDVCDIKDFCKKYLDPMLCAKVEILKLPESKIESWKNAKFLTEQSENLILKNHVRTAPLEAPEFVNKIENPKQFALDFPRPDKTFQLSGSDCIFHYSNRVPLVNVVVRFKFADHISKGYDAIKLSILSSMLLEGSKDFDKQENLDYLDGLGAHYNFQATTTYLEVINQNFELAFERVSHILSNPDFKEESLEKIKAITLSSLLQKKQDAASLASEKFNQLTLTGTEYSKSLDQSIKEVENLKIKDISDVYKKYFAMENLIISCDGDISENVFKQQVENLAKKLPLKSQLKSEITLPEIDFENLKQPEENKITLLRDQVLLFMGQLSPVNIKHEDLAGLKILNIVAFASLGSRLYQIREKTGLFYGVSGGFSINPGRSFSVNLIKTLVNPDNAEKTKSEFDRVIKEVAQSGITEKELLDAKQMYFGSLLNAYGTSGKIAENMAMLFDLNLGFDYYQNFWNKIEKLSLEEINNLAKKYYTTENMHVIQVGNF